MDIYDIVEELKNISNIIESNEIKSKINNVIKQINNIQDGIFEDLESIDPYSNGDEIDQIVSDIMEKVDYKTYFNNYCIITDEHNNKVIYK